MFDRKVLKARAKYVLARCFVLSIIACAIVSIAGGGFVSYGVNIQGVDFSAMSDIRLIAICATAGVLVLIGICVSIFISAPLRVGLKHFMLRAADFEASLDNLLYPFRANYKNVVWVTFVKNLYIGLWSLLGFVPLALGVWGLGLWDKMTQLLPEIKDGSVSAAMMLMLISGTILFVAIIFSIPAYIKELQYSMVDYILAENPDTKRGDAIRKSKDLMVGNKWAFVKLMFSFVGWQLIANLTCCIGNFLLAPYIEATYAQMYLEISGQGKDYQGYDFRNPFVGF